MFKILLIVNPVSGSFSKRKLDKVLDILKKKAESVNVVFTEYKGHAEELAKKSECNLIIAAGGDGLINETAKGIINTNKLFAVIPFGTANVFCCEYDIPLNPVTAAKKMNLQKYIQIPIGFIDNHLFLLMAGIGYDAEVVQKVEAGKYRFKKLAHVIKGLSALFHNYTSCKVYYNGNEDIMYHGIFSISASYAGNFKLGIIDRNNINLFYLPSNSKFLLIKTFLALFAGLGFKSLRASSSVFKVEGSFICQVDGELYKPNKSSIYVSIKKKAINLIK